MIRILPFVILIALGVALLLVPRFLEKETEKPDAGGLPAFESLVPLPRSNADASSPELIYRWQDASGTEHFSDRAPEDMPVSVVPLQKDHNRLPATTVDQGTEENSDARFN